MLMPNIFSPPYLANLKIKSTSGSNANMMLIINTKTKISICKICENIIVPIIPIPISRNIWHEIEVYCGISILVRPEGFEPPTVSLRGICSTNWAKGAYLLNTGLLCPWRESNPHQQLRRLLLYPLSYGDSVWTVKRSYCSTNYRLFQCPSTAFLNHIR